MKKNPKRKKGKIDVLSNNIAAWFLLKKNTLSPVPCTNTSSKYSREGMRLPRMFGRLFALATTFPTSFILFKCLHDARKPNVRGSWI